MMGGMGMGGSSSSGLGGGLRNRNRGAGGAKGDTVNLGGLGGGFNKNAGDSAKGLKTQDDTMNPEE